MESKEIIKTKTNFISLSLYLLGACFFGYIAYLSLTSKMKIGDEISQKESSFIKWSLFGLFLSFTIGCLYNLISVKIYSLTKQNLIINHPLLFSKKLIPISTIESVMERNVNMKMSRGMQNVASYNGKESLIELSNGKKIKFNSSAITNYSQFKKSISELI